jgi:8-oxo-dGTP pyrophosphatase MutT (NUDIX family)
VSEAAAGPSNPEVVEPVDRVRADALAVLMTWTAPDAEQDRLRRDYVAHLERQPDGVRRSCFPDHLTAGTLVLSHDGDAVLLNLHRKARRWFAFGGHIEPDDATLADAAHREALEESGVAGLAFDPEPVHLDLHEVGFCDPRGTVRHLDVRYCAVAPADAGHQASDESLDVRWWPLDGLPELEDEMHRLIALSRSRRF